MRIFFKSISHISCLFLLVTALLFSSGKAVAQDGEKLFNSNCAACHKMDKKSIGPALLGAEERWEGDRDRMRAWIKNSTQYLKDNPDHAYVQELFETYNKSVMTAMALSDAEVDAVLDYIRDWKPVDPPKPPGGDVVTVEQPDYTIYWLLGIMVIFLLVIKIMGDIKRSLKEVTATVEGKEPPARKGMMEAFVDWIADNKRTFATLVLLILVLSSVKLWFVVKSVGVNQDYAPEQPIKFSHKIHAGDNAIDCGYCHHSAYKGKNAGIPSVNVCMNCHKGISTGKVDGEKEIAKIYEAAGWDPNEMAYTKESKPIKWIRIHNLPDFTYFNHSQHVVVGKQKCQTCHGPVEEFGYPMKQHSELTMGWCINCHRETEVAMEGNEYYEKLHEQLLERHAEEGIENFTVEHIGGTECAKCHY
ncbi:c-type cytochrome [bacterium SCSIO 12741]|nr:c-type cytochrome [bacterium SCSIO 12741]